MGNTTPGLSLSRSLGAAAFLLKEQGSPMFVAGLALPTALVRLEETEKGKSTRDYICLFPSEEEAWRGRKSGSFPLLWTGICHTAGEPNLSVEVRVFKQK